MEFELFRMLAGASDVATVALVYLMWKLDKRLSRVEWEVGNENGKAKIS